MKIKTMSFPRAGTHYVTYLISINFFDSENYLKIYGGHDFYKYSPNEKIIYIFRKNEDIIKSLFKMRKRFGLNVNTIEELISAKSLKNIFKNYQNSETIVNKIDHLESITKTTDMFSKVEKDINTYISEHKKSFENKKNVCLIEYEEITKNFEKEMKKISDFLGIEKTEFTNTTDRMGWYSKNSNKNKFKK